MGSYIVGPAPAQQRSETVPLLLRQRWGLVDNLTNVVSEPVRPVSTTGVVDRVVIVRTVPDKRSDTGAVGVICLWHPSAFGTGFTCPPLREPNFEESDRRSSTHRLPLGLLLPVERSRLGNIYNLTPHVLTLTEPRTDRFVPKHHVNRARRADSAGPFHETLGVIGDLLIAPTTDIAAVSRVVPVLSFRSIVEYLPAGTDLDTGQFATVVRPGPGADHHQFPHRLPVLRVATAAHGWPFHTIGTSDGSNPGP